MNKRTVWLWVHWLAIVLFVYSFCQVVIDIVFYDWYHYWYDLITFGAGAAYAGVMFLRLWNKKAE